MTEGPLNIEQVASIQDAQSAADSLALLFRDSAKFLYDLAQDYANNPMLQGLIKQIPAIGWVLDASLKQSSTAIIRSRTRLLFEQLASGAEKLNPSLLEDNDFIYCFYCTYQAVLKNRNAEKVVLFTKLLLETSKLDTENLSSLDEFDEFMSIIDDISMREWVLLNEIYKIEQEHFTSSDGKDVPSVMKYWPKLITDIVEHLDIPRNQIVGMLARLNRTGCYLTITGSYLDYPGNMGTTTELYMRLRRIVLDNRQS